MAAQTYLINIIRMNRPNFEAGIVVVVINTVLLYLTMGDDPVWEFFAIVGGGCFFLFASALVPLKNKK